MKKASLILFVFLFGIVIKGFSQTAKPTDFWAGKWEITVMGTPNGDSKFIANLVRKEGKLTGDLTIPGDSSKPKIVITNVEESAEKMTISFTSEAYDVNIELTKVDDNHLKGMLMNMFESKAVRIKE